MNKTLSLIVALVIGLSIKAEVLVDDFKSGNFTSFGFGGPATFTQTGASILGGRRTEYISGTSVFFTGVSSGRFQIGANPGTLGTQLAWGTSGGGLPLGIDASSYSLIALYSAYAYLFVPAPVTITIFTDATHFSTSPAIDIVPPGEHDFVLSSFRGNADLRHINGITINLVPQIIAPGKTFGMSFNELSFE